MRKPDIIKKARIQRLRFVLSVSISFLSTQVFAQEKAEELNRINVEANGTRGFLSTSEIPIGRSGLNVDETAKSTQVFTEDFIQSVKPENIEDVLTLSPNVVFLGDNDGRENQFIIRGFQNAPVLRDGFRVESFGGIVDPEIFNLESIEVSKGPDSILYGESNAGGIINLSSKRPKSVAHGEVGLDTGSFDLFSTQLDVGGPVSEGGPNYRLVTLVKTEESWRNFDTKSERLFVAPSVQLNLSESTSLTLIGEFTRDEKPADFGTAINNDGKFASNPKFPNNHPQDSIVNDQDFLGYDLEIALSDSWVVENRLRYIKGGYDYSNLLLPFEYDSETGLYFRVPADQEQKNEELAVQLNLRGDVLIGGMRNRIAAGIDWRESSTENITRFDPETPFFLDFSNPDYSELPPPTADIPVADGFYSNDDVDRVGIYVLNHLNILDNLILSTGLRQESVERMPAANSSSTANDDSTTLPQIGFAYDLSSRLSLFSNYSESYAPSFSTDAEGQALDPEEGSGIELGLRINLSGGRLQMNAAIFDITRENVAQTDPDFPLASIASGEQTSRGFEIDLTGMIGEAWQIYSGYGYTDSEDKADNPGNQTVGVPEHTFSLWLARQLNQRLTIGAGIQHVGERFATQDNAVKIDAHTLLNAGLNYTKNQFRIGLNLYNITDEEYVESAFGSTSRSVHPGAPFSAILSARYTFH